MAKNAVRTFKFDGLNPNKVNEIVGKETPDGNYENLLKIEEAFPAITFTKEKNLLFIEKRPDSTAHSEFVKEDAENAHRVLRILSQKKNPVDIATIDQVIVKVKSEDNVVQTTQPSFSNDNQKKKRKLRHDNGQEKAPHVFVERLTMQNKNDLLMNFFGDEHENLPLFEKHLKVDIKHVQDQKHMLDMSSNVPGQAKFAKDVMLDLWQRVERNDAAMDEPFKVDEVSLLATIQKVKDKNFTQILSGKDQVLVNGPNGHVVKPRTQGHVDLVNASEQNDICFAIGPAGSGKTYTAVALAVKALKEKKVNKIILTRPAVEAGESLGFLPGDLKEKIDPYLRPLYDALDDMIPADKLAFYMSTRVIEIAPLAYMRGRTLDNAFIILDEAQNATDLQTKMFLTRIGANAKAIITGDMTQCDLPRGQKSGLKKAVEILEDVDGIGHVELQEDDIVRHHLVKKIVAAYKKEDERNYLEYEMLDNKGDVSRKKPEVIKKDDPRHPQNQMTENFAAVQQNDEPNGPQEECKLI